MTNQVGPTATLLLVHHLPGLAIAAAPDTSYMAVDEVTLEDFFLLLLMDFLS